MGTDMLLMGQTEHDLEQRVGTNRGCVEIIIAGCNDPFHESDIAESRILLNNILKLPFGLEPYSSEKDQDKGVLYLLARYEDKLVGSARLVMDPSDETIEKSGLMSVVNTDYLRYAEVGSLTPHVALNMGLAVIKSYRKGVYGVHIASLLQEERENIANQHNKQYILMRSRPAAAGVARRCGFTELSSETTPLPNGDSLVRSWFYKSLK
ncbi:MAG: hypothetical protein ABIJ08_06305 [Nanoarchaeota archaeon]